MYLFSLYIPTTKNINNNAEESHLFSYKYHLRIELPENIILIYLIHIIAKIYNI